ncbi:hypothetical protein FRC00_012221, partial [Tulasnella sp. 408]
SAETLAISANDHFDSNASSQAVGEEDSPYPEVRASVSNTDDPDMPTLTFRMWIVAYPFGKALDHFLPIRYWTISTRCPVVGGRTFSLNPGPFNIKEHALIFMMSGAALTPAYGMLMIIATEKDYGILLGTGYSGMGSLCTEITGFSLAAIARKLLIYPASVIWPNSLVQSALLNTLHAEEEKLPRQLTRLSVHGIVILLMGLLDHSKFVPASDSQSLYIINDPR